MAAEATSFPGKGAGTHVPPSGIPRPQAELSRGWYRSNPPGDPAATIMSRYSKTTVLASGLVISAAAVVVPKMHVYIHTQVITRILPRPIS